MLSECARASASAESRYRIAGPNSQPRAVMVVAFDGGSEAVVGHLAAQRPGPTVFRTAASGGIRPDGTATAGWLRDLTGHPVDLFEEIGRAHLVVMVVTMGTDASAAAVIGEVCRRQGVTTTTLVLGTEPTGPTGPTGPTSSGTLAQVRPSSMMLVTASSSDYVADLLAALRA